MHVNCPGCTRDHVIDYRDCFELQPPGQQTMAAGSVSDAGAAGADLRAAARDGVAERRGVRSDPIDGNHSELPVRAVDHYAGID